MGKKKLKKKFKTFLLIYFAMFTSFFIVSTYAKYYAQLSAGGSATIAKWNVTLDTSGSNTNLSLIAGNTTDTYALTVTSNSDVKVKYTIVISNVPSNMQASLDGGSYQNESGNTITFNGIINANAANKTKVHSIVFNAPVGSVTPGTNNVDIDVLFEQVQ